MSRWLHLSSTAVLWSPKEYWHMAIFTPSSFTPFFVVPALTICKIFPLNWCADWVPRHASLNFGISRRQYQLWVIKFFFLRKIIPKIFSSLETKKFFFFCLGGLVINDLKKEIRFESVAFSSPMRMPTFTELTFRIPKSTVTAIVGPSGSGKSTIAHLLLR